LEKVSMWWKRHLYKTIINYNYYQYLFYIQYMHIYIYALNNSLYDVIF